MNRYGKKYSSFNSHFSGSFMPVDAICSSRGSSVVRVSTERLHRTPYFNTQATKSS